jgi:hypothetical protein
VVSPLIGVEDGASPLLSPAQEQHRAIANFAASMAQTPRWFVAYRGAADTKPNIGNTGELKRRTSQSLAGNRPTAAPVQARTDIAVADQ